MNSTTLALAQRFLSRLLGLIFFWRPLSVGTGHYRPNRDQVRSVIGGESPYYLRVRFNIILPGSFPEPIRRTLLLTSKEYATAVDRAERNPEDCKQPRTFSERITWPLS